MRGQVAERGSPTPHPSLSAAGHTPSKCVPSTRRATPAAPASAHLPRGRRCPAHSTHRRVVHLGNWRSESERRGSGLAGVEIQIRDPQGRWQKVVRSYEASGGSFSASIAWDRTFADGTTAPIGEYDVVVTARDLAEQRKPRDRATSSSPRRASPPARCRHVRSSLPRPARSYQLSPQRLTFLA